MTIDELEQSLNEEFDASILSVSYADDALSILLECDDWDSDGRLWLTITCRELASWTATPGWIGSIHETGDHPALGEHNEDQLLLYFSSCPPNAFELIGRLCESLALMYNRACAPSGLLHAKADTLSAGSGMLAIGPRPVIDHLRRVAEPFVACSVVPGRTPAGGYRLLDFETCYVICRSIDLSVSTKPPN